MKEALLTEANPAPEAVNRKTSVKRGLKSENVAIPLDAATVNVPPTGALRGPTNR